MEMMDSWLMVFLKGQLAQMPMSLVLLVGAILAIVLWRRHPGVSLATLLAIGAMLLLRLTNGVIYAWLPSYQLEMDWSSEQLGWMYFGIGVVSNLGSSGNLMGNFIRQEVELATVKEDAVAVVVKCSKSSCLGFDGLDATIKTFAHGVRDAVAKVGQNVVEVSLEHLGDFDDWLEPTTR